MRETATVFELVERLNITLSAIHVKGDLNVLADMLSRRHVILRNEWRLADKTFRWVCANSLWGSPSLELFANQMNRHLPRYVSPCADPHAHAVDALVCTWPREVLYAFPPFTILDRVLLKIQQERPGSLLLIAPVRPLANWYSGLRLFARSVTLIPASVLQLTQPHFEHSLAQPHLLSLALWHIQCPASGTSDTLQRS